MSTRERPQNTSPREIETAGEPRDEILSTRLGERPAGATAAAAGDETRASSVFARIGSLLLASGLIGAVGWAAYANAAPSFTGEAASVLVQPKPGEQQRVCAGPVITLGLQGQQTAAAANGQTRLIGAGDTHLSSASPIASVGGPATGDAASPVVYRAPGERTDGEATQFAVTQTVQLPGGRGMPSGFTATECQMPTGDQWVIADGPSSGTSSVLSLANVTDRPATVQLHVRSPEGPVDAGKLSEIEIPAMSQRAISVAAIAPQTHSVAIRVVSTQGLVAPSVHQVLTAGLSGRGAEISPATLAPTTRLVIPGVPMSSGTVAGDTDSAATTLVRMLNTGAGEANATVRILGLDGTEIRRDEVVLQPGQVVDDSLAELPSGIGTILVDADGPVIAAARSMVASGGTGADVAWYQAAARLSGEAQVAVPEGPSPRLFIANTGKATLPVSIERNGEPAKQLEIPAGQTAQVDVNPGTYRVTGLESAHAAVTYAGQSALASFPVTSSNPLAEPITVYR